jgi:hypothetical protein
MGLAFGTALRDALPITPRALAIEHQYIVHKINKATKVQLTGLGEVHVNDKAIPRDIAPCQNQYFVPGEIKAIKWARMQLAIGDAKATKLARRQLTRPSMCAWE